jgi:hypothetical protein
VSSDPQLQPNRITYDEVKNKKLNRITSDRTVADSEQKEEYLFVCQQLVRRGGLQHYPFCTPLLLFCQH